MRIVGIVVILGGLYFLRFAFMPEQAGPYNNPWVGLFAVFLSLVGAGLFLGGTYPDRGWAKAIGWVASAGFRVIVRLVIR